VGVSSPHCSKGSPYPAQDLSQRLVSGISIELESPTDWEPYKPESAEEESRILNAVRSKVGDRVDVYCREVLVRDPRTGFWLPAYENIHGPGTKVRRARTVARILEDRAQLPNEGLGKFTKDVWRIVEETVAEICSLEQEKEIPCVRLIDAAVGVVQPGTTLADTLKSGEAMNAAQEAPK
jgi:hypothetical protein